ncbi:MAG: cysteine hydrolase [Chloroflexi bacterium]|nr:cysteine hydrolase [Chloroflexota bacterium]
MRRNGDVLVSLEQQIDPAHTALVIVDVQNDFVHPEGRMSKNVVRYWKDTTTLIPPMLENLERFLQTARRVEIPVVFVQMIGDLKYQSPAGMAQRLRNGSAEGHVCLEGSWGADFYGDIHPSDREQEFVVQKHRYSAFWGTNLEMVLRSNGIETLLMTGDATNGCVESTTRDAFCNDFYVVTVADCCGDFDVGRHEFSLRKMEQAYGYVVQSEEIGDIWRRGEFLPA